MRWLNSKVSKGLRPSLWKQILLFSVMLCFLVVFNHSFADDLTDPDDPNLEHPWDDLLDADWDQIPVDPPEIEGLFMLQFGFDSWIIVHLQPVGQKDGFTKGKAFGPVEKNRGYLFILIK